MKSDFATQSMQRDLEFLTNHLHDAEYSLAEMEDKESEIIISLEEHEFAEPPRPHALKHLGLRLRHLKLKITSSPERQRERYYYNSW